MRPERRRLRVRLRRGQLRRPRAEAARLGLAAAARARRAARLGRRRGRRPRACPPTSAPPPYLARWRCRVAEPAHARGGAGHRRPPRRRRVRLRGHAGQVVGRRRGGPPPRSAPTARRGAGIRPRTRPRWSSRGRPSSGPRPRRWAPPASACSSAGPTASSSRACASGGRWPTGSAGSSPRSCSGTTRGSATGSTPTTATPGCSPSKGVVAARDPHFFPEQALPHHRPEALLLFEADEPDHVEDVDRLRRRQARRAPRPHEPAAVHDGHRPGRGRRRGRAAAPGLRRRASSPASATTAPPRASPTARPSSSSPTSDAPTRPATRVRRAPRTTLFAPELGSRGDQLRLGSGGKWARREMGPPWRARIRVQRRRPSGRNGSSGSASATNQASWASSCSSWPGPHPE